MFVVLDDAEAVSMKDVSHMLEQISALPIQLEYSLSKTIDIDKGNFANLCICGLGGSAMSGEILHAYLDEHSRYPSAVVRDTVLPNWVDEKTFVLVLSYSGNTRETLKMYNDACSKGAKVVGVTSGGELKRLLTENNNEFIEVPSGLQPRAALGYILGACAVILKNVEICDIHGDLEKMLPILKEECQQYSPEIPMRDNLAKKVADELENTLPAIYGTIGIAPVAQRWRTQINENSKMITICGVLPELNHNQIVGWLSSPSAPATAVFLRAATDSEDISKIVDATTALFIDSCIDTVVIELQGNTQLECIMRGIILGDYVSYYLAALRGIDPTPIEPISCLKDRMSSV